MATTNATEEPQGANLHSLKGLSFGARQLFYLVTPAETTHEKWQDVPNYVNQAIPFFVVLVLLEMAYLNIEKSRPLPRWNDALSSLTAGVLSQLPLNIEVIVYIYVYNNFCVVSLPWESPITWVVAFLLVDLGYYWVHRMAHEVNFMWAAHQVHHSSEDYNLSTALRQSVLQRYNSWVFYLPMAFFVPPSHFVVHIQFNLLYQFWIHTEVVRSIGPLEYILNTPSHHRVHHGRNRYCIDKNYAGVLIIWDRIFGTFAPEEEKVVYGLVHPLASWNPIYAQLCHWQYLLQTAWNAESFSHKMSILLKGPGWSPGKPRLGELEDIPDIKAPQEKYDRSLPLLGNLYCWSHFVLVLAAEQMLVRNRSSMSQWTIFLCILFLLWTLTNVGLLYEHKWYAAPLEVLRCLVIIAADISICSKEGAMCPATFYLVRGAFFFSFLVMALQTVRSLKVSAKKLH